MGNWGKLFLNKVRQEWHCHNDSCKKRIPTGSFCICDDNNKWYKLCIDCGKKEIIRRRERNIQNHQDRMNNLNSLEEEISISKDKIEKENAVANLRSERGFD